MWQQPTTATSTNRKNPTFSYIYIDYTTSYIVRCTTLLYSTTTTTTSHGHGQYQRTHNSHAAAVQHSWSTHKKVFNFSLWPKKIVKWFAYHTKPSIHPTNHSYRPPDPTMLLTPYTIAVASSPKHCYSLTHTSCISICIGILKPSSTHRGIQTPGLCKPHDRRQWICSGLPVALRRHMQHPQHPTQPNQYHPISQKQSHPNPQNTCKCYGFCLHICIIWI